MSLLDDEFPMMLEREAGMREHIPEMLVAFGDWPMLNPTKTKEHGREIYDDIVHIKLLAPGDQKTITLQPADAAYKRRFPRAYASYEARTKGAKESGTALVMWPPISRGMSFTLMASGIRTVETLAGLSDEHLNRFPGPVRELRDKAVAFLRMAEDTAAVTRAAGEKTELLNQIASLQAQINALQQASAKPDTETAARQGKGKAA